MKTKFFKILDKYLAIAIVLCVVLPIIISVYLLSLMSGLKLLFNILIPLLTLLIFISKLILKKEKKLLEKYLSVAKMKEKYYTFLADRGTSFFERMKKWECEIMWTEINIYHSNLYMEAIDKMLIITGMLVIIGRLLFSIF